QKVIHCAAMQHSSCNDHQPADQNIQDDVPGRGDVKAQKCHDPHKQQQVAEELRQPQTAVPEAGGESFERRSPEGHYFTSMVAASVVDMTEGWYMGCTDAGLMRNLPGFTILSR